MKRITTPKLAREVYKQQEFIRPVLRDLFDYFFFCNIQGKIYTETDKPFIALFFREEIELKKNQLYMRNTLKVLQHEA